MRTFLLAAFALSVSVAAGCSEPIDTTMNRDDQQSGLNYPKGPYGYIEGSVIEDYKFQGKAPVAGDYASQAMRNMFLDEFHNDDKTSIEFGVRVLMQFFGHDLEKSMEIMLNVHKTCLGIAGVYPREVAELKQEQTTSAARTQKFPLVVTIEPVEK